MSICVTSRSSRSSPCPSRDSASLRAGPGVAPRSTSHWARSAASGVRSSCAASAVKRRSRASVASMRANSPFIACTSGRSSAAVAASPSGLRSSAPRERSSPLSACSGATARLTAQVIASSSTGSISTQGSTWPSVMLRVSSSRSCAFCPAATSQSPPAGCR